MSDQNGYGYGDGGYPQGYAPGNQLQQPQPQYGGYPQGQAPMGPGMPPYGMPPQPRKGLGGGAIAAIVIGGVALLGGLAWLVFGMPRNAGTDPTRPVPMSQPGGNATNAQADPAQGDASATPGDGSSSATSGDADAQPGTQAPATNASTEWQSGRITINGNAFTLHKSTYDDLVNAGWHLDDMTTETLDSMYHGEFILNPSQTSAGLSMRFMNDSLGGFDALSVEFVNLGSSAVDFRQCAISGIYVDAAFMGGGQVAPEVTVEGGGSLGMTLDEIAAIYGEPYDSYRSDSYASLSYRSEDYSHMLEFQSSDGNTCDEIVYALL